MTINREVTIILKNEEIKLFRTILSSAYSELNYRGNPDYHKKERELLNVLSDTLDDRRVNYEKED